MQSVTLPEYVDEDVHDRLMALDFGTDERAQYLAALRKRLSFPAYEAAVNRLNEAIALARKLKSEGKCVSAAEFADPAVRQRLLVRERMQPNPVKPVGLYSLSRSSEIVETAERLSHSIFLRDLFAWV